MSSDCVLISCTECDYNSKWKCNVARHMLRKHTQQNVSIPQQNVSIAQQNVSIAQQNVSIEQQNVSINCNKNPLSFECDLCTKKFNKQWILTRHRKICTGIIDSLTCSYCNKVFGKRASKSRHVKTCISNPEIQNITNNITNNK